ncbi:MAG: NfeD family protein [Deferribacteraceae bacterium]|jgi:membrane protein implicated in regulation of membrane protease activity|nr:NfeD family protein [Deferribacteraceae bacterium]
MGFNIYKFLFSPSFWVAVAVFFLLAEVFTFHLVALWFFLSALLMVLLTLIFDIPHLLQIALFLTIAILLLLFTRPFTVKKLNVGKAKTNVNALWGMNAVVIKKISKYERGEIKVGGQIWGAVSADGGEIGEGSEVIIERIEGVKAVVRIAGEEQTAQEPYVE